MKQKQLAKEVFETYSRPLRTCWQLEGLGDYNTIYYAPGNECFITAQEIAKQIKEEYHHDVELKTFWSVLAPYLKENDYPDNFYLCCMEITTPLWKAFTAPDAAIVCFDEFEKRVKHRVKYEPLKQDQKISIFNPKKFEVDVLSPVMKNYDYDHDFDIATGYHVKKVSYICVFASERNMWPFALKLYKEHKHYYPNDMVKLALFLDYNDNNWRYINKARHYFGRFSNIATSDLCVIPNTEAFHEVLQTETYLWVLSSSKSYLSQIYSKSYFYIYDEYFDGLWLSKSKIGKHLLLQDILQLATVNKDTQGSTLATEFINSYTPKVYSQKMMNIYYFFKRVQDFGLL